MPHSFTREQPPPLPCCLATAKSSFGFYVSFQAEYVSCPKQMEKTNIWTKT